MKVKTSRGIVMKLICCMAMVVLSAVTAFSQARGTVSITAASHSGSNNTYTYTLTSGPALQVGQIIVISGMSDPGNNGTFSITALGTGTFTVSNASGANATSQIGTGTVAFRPTSGALLAIIGNVGSTAVNQNIYDSQIHTTAVQTVPVADGFNGSNCNSTDAGFSTDAYVLQGGSGTGCDPGDTFETSQGTGSANIGTITANGYRFDITTIYTLGPMCNTNNTICVGGDSGNLDTGFLTVINNSGAGADFTGTISLKGTSPIAGGFCPAAGSALDQITSTLSNGSSWVFALSTDSSNCGGFNQSQTGTLAASGSLTFSVGPDSYEIDGANNAGNESIKFSILPVLQSSTSLPIGFFVGNVFPSDTCTPLASFSAPTNPVCVEVQLDCSGNADCSTFANEQAWHLATLFNDSLPGTPVFLKTDAACPPPLGFDQNIFLSYDPFSDPLPKSGSGGNSCFVFGYFPTITGTSTFVSVPGYASKFFSPVANPPVVNNVNAGNAIPFIWQEFDLNNNLVTTPNFFTGGFCTTSTTGCPANSVAVQFVQTPCPSGGATNIFAAGSSGLQFNSTTNTFKINAKTPKSFAGTCQIGEVIVTGSVPGLLSTHTALFKFH